MTVAALEKSVTHRVEEAWLTEQGVLSALVTSSNQRAKWHFSECGVNRQTKSQRAAARGTLQNISGGCHADIGQFV